MSKEGQVGTGSALEGAPPSAPAGEEGHPLEFLDLRDLVKEQGAVTWNGNSNGDAEGGGNSSATEKPLSNGNGPPSGNGVVKWNGNGNGAPSRNGLTGGRGLVNGNGLINGNGFVNGAGKGLTGGSGLINGNGLVNGCQRPAGEGALETRRLSGFGRAFRQKNLRLAVVTVASVILITSIPILALLTGPAPRGMAVDGDLADWDGRTVLSDGPDPSVASRDADIVRYASAVSGNDAFFMAEVAGRMLAGKGDGVDTVEILVDADLDATTGYLIRGIGADNRIEAWGYDGTVRGCNFYSFPAARGNADWNGWASLGSGRACSFGHALEISVWKSGLAGLSKEGFRALFQASSMPGGASDFSNLLAGPSGGALLASQEPVDKPALAVQPEPQPVLKLALEARAKTVRLRGIELGRSGNASLSDIAEVELRSGGRVVSSGRFTDNRLSIPLDAAVSPGSTFAFDVCVKAAAGAVSGRVFGIGLSGPDSVKVDRGTVTASGFGLRSYYIGAPPGRITVDGAFGDWDAVTAHPDPAGDAPSPCIDLLDGRAVKDSSSLSFMVRVDGSLLGGESLPPLFQRRPLPAPPGPSGPGPVSPVPPLLVPQDTVTAYIDADNSNLTGFRAGGLEIGAEYALSVTGAAGKILASEAFAWSPAAKSWTGRGTFEAAKDPDRMELQAPLAALNISLGPVFRVQLFATDWSGRADAQDGALRLQDPLQLADDSVIYSSTDGVSWKTETTIDNTLTWRDMCTDSSGYVYCITIKGIVYKSSGDWTSWSKIIDANLGNIVAVATDGTNFYCLKSNGLAYKASSGGAWSQQGDVGNDVDYEDMCIDSSGNLYAVRSDTCATLSKSTDGGKNWAAFGDKNVGNSGGGETNVAIVHGTGWSSTDYLFILQSDGKVRYDTDGKTKDPWANTSACGNLTSQTLVDIDLDATNGVIWTVTTSGKVYTFTFDTSAPDGTWNTTLGTASGTNGTWAIAVNLVPEFQDIALPLAGMLAVVILVRSRRRKNGQ